MIFENKFYYYVPLFTINTNISFVSTTYYINIQEFMQKASHSPDYLSNIANVLQYFFLIIHTTLSKIKQMKIFSLNKRNSRMSTSEFFSSTFKRVVRK